MFVFRHDESSWGGASATGNNNINILSLCPFLGTTKTCLIVEASKIHHTTNCPNTQPRNIHRRWFSHHFTLTYFLKSGGRWFHLAPACFNMASPDWFNHLLSRKLAGMLPGGLLVKAVIPSWIQYLKQQQQKQERISPFPNQFLEVVVL